MQMPRLETARDLFFGYVGIPIGNSLAAIPTWGQGMHVWSLNGSLGVSPCWSVLNIKCCDPCMVKYGQSIYIPVEEIHFGNPCATAGECLDPQGDIP